MSSILNSISSGDLQVQQVPGEIPVKEDSILDLLVNSEIEFTTCPKPNNSLDNFNTGFGENQELHYKTPCQNYETKTPLYKENYLRDFVTKEEKAEVLKSLGLFNIPEDSSSISAKNNLPTSQDWKKVVIKQLQQEGVFFSPAVALSSVFDSDGKTLDTKLKQVDSLISQCKKDIQNIVNPSDSKNISSLGDIQKFLKGFNNGDNLFSKIDELNQETLRFETTGQINSFIK